MEFIDDLLDIGRNKFSGLFNKFLWDTIKNPCNTSCNGGYCIAVASYGNSKPDGIWLGLNDRFLKAAKL